MYFLIINHHNKSCIFLQEHSMSSSNQESQPLEISDSSDDADNSADEETTGYPIYIPEGSPVGFPIESPRDSTTTPESSLESTPVGSRATSPMRCLPTTSAASRKRPFEDLENGKIHNCSYN